MSASCLEHQVDTEDDQPIHPPVAIKRASLHMVGAEERWRCPVAAGPDPSEPERRIVVSRWSLDGAHPTEVVRAGADHHTVCVGLAPMTLTFRVGGRVVFDGHARPGG